jgi:LPXTG-motif cell wall-anchored protein
LYMLLHMMLPTMLPATGGIFMLPFVLLLAGALIGGGLGLLRRNRDRRG